MKRIRRRGFVLLAVLFILLVLLVGAGTFFASASRTQLTAQSLASQQIALSRAELAAQRAIRDIRARRIIPNALFDRPTPNGIPDCASNCLFFGPVDNGNALPPSQGGGLQWDYVVFRSNQAGPTNRFVVQGNGYYGTTTTSPSFTSARIEVEIDVDNNSNTGRNCNACTDGFMP
jgi:type II secretory pathway pseudopilin PulG